MIFPYPFSEGQRKYIRTKFSRICSNVYSGNKDIFDNFCRKIYPFCLEIYEIGKDLTYNHYLIETPTNDIPYEDVIFEIGANISAYILPVYKNYLAKSESLYEMVCLVINETKFSGGRNSFITEIWSKTKRTDSINIKSLIADIRTAPSTVDALLKLRDGRFVKEVIDADIQSQLSKESWSFWKKKILLYIERYG
jgi:hypothetical protein